MKQYLSFNIEDFNSTFNQTKPKIPTIWMYENDKIIDRDYTLHKFVLKIIFHRLLTHICVWAS